MRERLAIFAEPQPAETVIAMMERAIDEQGAIVAAFSLHGIVDKYGGSVDETADGGLGEARHLVGANCLGFGELCMLAPDVLKRQLAVIIREEIGAGGTPFDERRAHSG